jgi:hypothetical protein
MDVDRIRASSKETIDPFFDIYEENQRKYNYRKELIVGFFFIYCILFFLDSSILMSHPQTVKNLEINQLLLQLK